MHPSIDEFDCGSWLDGSLSEHDVLSAGPEGYQLDGAPSFRTDGLGWTHDRNPAGSAAYATYCEQHAYERAAIFGYTGPVEVRTAYQPGHPFKPEQAMLLHDADGTLISIATYSYGRAYFEPGEPRTDPCSVCSSETLLSAV